MRKQQSNKIKKFKIEPKMGAGTFWTYIDNGETIKHDYDHSPSGILAEKINEIIDKLNNT